MGKRKIHTHKIAKKELLRNTLMIRYFETFGSLPDDDMNIADIQRLLNEEKRK